MILVYTESYNITSPVLGHLVYTELYNIPVLDDPSLHRVQTPYVTTTPASRRQLVRTSPMATAPMMRVVNRTTTFKLSPAISGPFSSSDNKQTALRVHLRCGSDPDLPADEDGEAGRGRLVPEYPRTAR